MMYVRGTAQLAHQDSGSDHTVLGTWGTLPELGLPFFLSPLLYPDGLVQGCDTPSELA